MKPNRPWANVERLHRLLEEETLDAVVVRSGQNVTYLSGVVYPEVRVVEPFVEYWRTQDLILLTETGAEILSTQFDTSELMAIGT